MNKPKLSPKSSAELQTEAALDHFSIMIKNQNIKVGDALYISEMVVKILYKCEELRISRDNHKHKRFLAEQELKEYKLK